MGSLRGSHGMAIAVPLCMSMVVGGLSKGQSKPRGLAAAFNAWNNNAKFSPDGRGVDLILDQQLSSEHLCPSDSAGTVTTFYMASKGPKHNEFDFEFQGNRSGQPYLLHTKVFVDGVGGREQQIFLDFDPTTAYQYYSWRWNKDLVVFYVNNKAIRMFKNLEGVVPNFKFPNFQPMTIYCSIWDGSNWATEGGRVKLNWASAPFVSSYSSFKLNGCAAATGYQNGVAACQGSRHAAPQRLDGGRHRQMKKVKANQVKYNYCDDRGRYPVAPPESAHNTL